MSDSSEENEKVRTPKTPRSSALDAVVSKLGGGGPASPKLSSREPAREPVIETASNDDESLSKTDTDDSGSLGLASSPSRSKSAGSSGGSRVRRVRRGELSPVLGRVSSAPMIEVDPATLAAAATTSERSEESSEKQQHSALRRQNSIEYEDDSEDSASVSSSQSDAGKSTRKSSGVPRLSASTRSPRSRRVKVASLSASTSTIGVSPLRNAHADDPTTSTTPDDGDGAGDDEHAPTTATTTTSRSAARSASASSSADPNVVVEKEWHYVKDTNGKTVVRAATLEKLVELLAVADALPGLALYASLVCFAKHSSFALSILLTLLCVGLTPFL
jgi:hypothetical protein